MRRRRLLATVGAAGAGAFAGCGGFLSTDCEPGDDPLGDVSIDRADYELEYDRLSVRTFTVRGAVVYEPVLGVVVDDGTWLTDLRARMADERVNQEYFDVGDCVEATGRLNVVQAGANEMPFLEVTSIDRVGTVDGVEPLPDVPHPRFDPDWDAEARESVFRLVGGDPVTARNLVVRWRPKDSGIPWPEADRAPWHELTDVAPDETVPAGSEVRFPRDRIDVSMLWRSFDRGWRREVKGLGVGRMN